MSKTARSSTRFYTGILALICCIATLALASSTWAQSEKPLEGNIAGTTESSHEQTIYVPYDQLQAVFERQGRGVFLPYEQYQKLWQEARSANRQNTKPTTPADAVLISAENTATIEKQLIVVRSVLKLELLHSGWHKIPLHLQDAAILSATIDNEPARIVHDPENGYQLILENQVDGAVTKQVELEYAKAYEKTPGQNSVSFMPPQAPINQWRIVISDPGVKVQVEPMLASTEATKDTKGTEVIAFVGATPTLRIRWVPKAEGATGMAPLANVFTQHQTMLEEGMMRTTVQFTYNVDRSELTTLAVAVPADQKVINVFDPNVRRWSLEPNAEKRDSSQRLVIELFEPAKKKQDLVIELESPLASQDNLETSVQPLVSLDASRQHGTVAILVGQGFRAEPLERKGLMQMDASELPKGSASEPWTFAYRFATVPFTLKYKIEKVQPSIRIEQLTEVVLEPQSMTIELSTTHNIENAGVFQFAFDFPPDFELVQVIGRAADQVEAASIDSFRFTNDAKDRLEVNLKRKAIGRVGTWIQLRKKLDDPNLLTPTGAASILAVPIPRSTGEFIQWIDGTIAVYAPQSLRLNPVETLGARDSATNQSRVPFNSTCLQRHPGLSESIAMSHAMEPVKIALSAERKRPYVTVRQLVNVTVEPGTVQHKYMLDTQVQFSSVPNLRLDVPESIVKDLRVETPGIRQTTITPAPSDLSPGYAAWELTADAPWLGQRTVSLGMVKRIEGLDIGKVVAIAIPSLVPRNVDQSWGQIVLNRKDSIDLQIGSGTTGLRPIDPRYDISGGQSFPDASLAFEFHSEWILQIAATRYALEQVKQTSIERAYVRAVITRSNQIGIHAIYRLRNAGQRLALTLPKEVEFDSQPLLINGQNATLERGTAEQLYIPLTGFDPVQPVVAELRYTVKGDHRNIELPEFPDSPAVQTVYLSVFLPKERVLLGTMGPWTEEFSLSPRTGWKYEPNNNQTAAQLVAWVKQGTSITSQTDFQTDGSMYLYSSLKPVSTPEGALKLSVADERWWGGILIGVFLLIGLCLLGLSFQAKIVALACMTAAALVTGVFAPTLACQLMTAPSAIGGALMGILFATGGFLKLANRPKRNVPAQEKAENVNPTSFTPETPKAVSTDSESQGQIEQGGADHV
jgi:hypothetical protein